MVIAIGMWVTSIARVRRKMFEVFFYTHHLYTLYILFYAIHVGVAYMSMFAPGIFLFLIDRHLRFLQSRHHARLLSARLLPCHTLELTFSKTPGLSYNPTSIMFLNVPSISKLQWHPFTVNSNCNMERDKLSVVIKTEGSWSRKLYHKLSSSHHLDHLEVSVEGPYGPSASHFLRHELLVMVSGGSGVTPFISIIRELIFQSQQPNTHVPRVLVISSFKNSYDLSTLDLILPFSGIPSEISKLQLQIEAYVTREKEDERLINAQKPKIQTMWFKPSLSDSPISPVLGPDNWLWLAVIITSSFLMFLLLLGIVTRYYIYPIENNGSDEVYPWTYKVLWFLFLICAAICVCSSAVFLCCKRLNASESTLILKVEGPTPPTSPGLWTYGVEQELESVPHHSLVLATKVHFGARPDLKKILLENKEEDVGVLVCGPKKMRHEIARICSSGLAKNLHFEAISFNW